MNIFVTIRAYEELNDYLPTHLCKTDFSCELKTGSNVRGLLSHLGIPSNEIDLTLVNGFPADLGQVLQNNDRISLYPVFESLDVSETSRHPQSPLRNPKYITDRHLGSLAEILRLLGFDVLEPFDDLNAEQIAQLNQDNRIVLTAEQDRLSENRLDRIILIKETELSAQVSEVIERLDLQRSIVRSKTSWPK